MAREGQAKVKRWKLALLAFLMLALALAISALVVFKVFTVKKVIVTGNEHYDDETIAQCVLNDEYSWNTLYVYLKYRLKEPEAIPFVDTMEVTMRLPHTIEIEVYEKGLLGYVYLDSLGQNAYFDKDGIVVEASSEVIEGVPRVTGLSVDSVVLYEMLPIEERSLLRNLLSLTQALKKYGLQPEEIICGEDRTFLVKYGDIRVQLGNADHLSDKVLRLSYILPNLEGEHGTLHLESWTEQATDISFERA